MNYNLLEEKWLPVLWKNGNTTRVSIIESLTQAHRIRQIAASNPMDRMAILRFLLALLYWCKRNPPDGEDPHSMNWFSSNQFTKLNDNRDNFNLLGGGARFYQCRPRPGKAKKLSANYLIQEVPTGTNIWHFRHSTDKKNGLCPACCAMGLLRLPLFATSDGSGKPPGINAKPPIYVIPMGSFLAETLWLSWQVSSSNLGTPAWEKPDLQLPHGDIPLLTGLSWLPRRVWLDDPEGPEANCISCGRKEYLIRQCVFAGIGSMKSDGGREWEDPNVIPDNKDEVMRPGNPLDASGAAAGQWAKIMAGVLRGQKADGKRRLWVVGFATVQNAKYLEAIEYEIPVPSAPDYQKVQENIEKIEMWRREGNLVRKVIRKVRSEASSRKHIEIPPMVVSIRPHVEGKVSAQAGELITGSADAWERAAREYRPMVAVIAKSLSPGYTTAALQRRKEIASVKPNMGPNTKVLQKSGRKKGGDK